MILVGSYFLWLQHSIKISVELLAFIQLVAYSITIVSILFAIRQMKKQLYYWKKDVLLKNIFIQSLPFAIVVLFMTIYARIDTILLEKFSKNGLEEVGIYASAFRLLDTANMFGYLFAGLLLPMFATLLGKKKELLPLLELSLTLMILGTVSVTAIVFCNRFEISTILYHQSNPYWGNVLGSLIFCLLPTELGIIFLVRY